MAISHGNGARAVDAKEVIGGRACTTRSATVSSLAISTIATFGRLLRRDAVPRRVTRLVRRAEVTSRVQVMAVRSERSMPVLAAVKGETTRRDRATRSSLVYICPATLVCKSRQVDDSPLAFHACKAVARCPASQEEAVIWAAAVSLSKMNYREGQGRSVTRRKARVPLRCKALPSITRNDVLLVVIRVVYGDRRRATRND